MMFPSSRCLQVLLIAALALSAGCDGPANPTAAAAGAAPAPPPVAESGFFTGRITSADGTPIALPGVEFEVNMNGVTAVGENNNFRPPIAADGTFKLKLPQGLFYPPYGTITFPFEGKKYIAELDPVSPLKGTRDGAPGIAQNFVWRITGPRPRALNPDINNATHWYGITLPTIYATYRSDTQQSTKPLPDGTKIVWTFKPTSKLVDGSDGKTVTFERMYSAMSSLDSVNDLPPADYEFSAIAILPDGTTKPALVEEFSERKFKPTATLKLQPDASDNSTVLIPMQISFVVE